MAVVVVVVVVVVAVVAVVAVSQEIITTCWIFQISTLVYWRVKTRMSTRQQCELVVQSSQEIDICSLVTGNNYSQG